MQLKTGVLGLWNIRVMQLERKDQWPQEQNLPTPDWTILDGSEV